MTIQDQAEGPGRIAAIRHRIGFLDVVGGWSPEREPEPTSHCA